MFAESLLSLHLSASLGLGLPAIGLSFLANAAAFTLACVVTGWVADTVHTNPWTLSCGALTWYNSTTEVLN